MDLNFSYNSFDLETHKLDDIYKNLPLKDIIQNKSDFCLINKGIQHLFKKNIVIFKPIYKSENLKFNYEKFDKKLQSSEYSILIILTQDNRRFGAFFKSNVKENNSINNIRINNLNNQQMNMYNQYAVNNYGMNQQQFGYNNQKNYIINQVFIK